MEDLEPLRKTLEHYRQLRQQKLDELRPIESMIRQLENDLGESPSVPEVDPDVAAQATAPAGVQRITLGRMAFIKPDEFYAMSQTDAAKAYLRMVGHAIPFDNLVAALRKGGAKLGG